jgi:ADP-ribose pyrophosphatase YjhB (NUDIX family)
MKKFYVGVKGIVREKGKGILILQHTEGHWDTPGGRMDGNETIEDTLHRELGEEVPGIADIEMHDILGAFRIPRDIDGDTSLVLIHYLVDAKVPDPIQLSHEHQKAIWVTERMELPEGMNPEFRTILEGLLN